MDEQLRKLIAEVAKHPSPTPERQKAVNRLLIAIQHLPGLAKSAHPDYLYALNRTYKWICENIQNFESRSPSLQASLVQWINGYLYWRIHNLYVPDNRAPLSFDELVSGEETSRHYLEHLSATGINAPNLTGIDGYIEQLQTEETERIGIRLKRYIQEDRNGRLRNCHPQQCSECNCQLLSQRLLLQDPPDRLATLAREFDVNYQTLNKHWKRSCLKLLQEIAISLGYHSD
ncbi:hypothetical protein [Limnofasciculus baicalensis]|uniref:Sigma-70 family RNA polymerase sigma factor n=1 Tax=Limnofasciculus baicalensis BBK-W-15 TaxID=2699891 RepID=A0AAE3KUQ4_9CYAN|nr:hypothetical protein [Limnofasciculus baicalensis]MCP2731762.1 hypothetical protein [Limnofasciculus baicalensis BBK-W-15]